MSVDIKDDKKMRAVSKDINSKAKVIKKNSADRRISALNVKTSANERQLIEDAAFQERLELSSYIRRSLIKQAEIDLSIRREFIVSDDAMDDFIAIMNRSAQDKPNLRKLLTEDFFIND